MIYVLLFYNYGTTLFWVLGVSKTVDRHLGFKSEAKKEKIKDMAHALSFLQDKTYFVNAPG